MSKEIETTKNTTPDDKPSPLGLLGGSLIIIATISLIAFYISGKINNSNDTDLEIPTLRPTAAENNEPESTKAEAEAEIIEILSTSDELSAIEADLSATNLNSLNKELNAIEAELESTLR